MTAAARSSSQTVLKRLAGALAALCLALVVLAVDQRLAVEGWRAARDVATPLAGRLWDWARDLRTERNDAWTGLGEAWRGDDAQPLTAAPQAAPLTGELRPGDDATRATTGGATFIGATIRFEQGEAIRTVPLRIAWGGEAFAEHQTFAARLNATPDAQIELRRIVAPSGAGAATPSRLCQGDIPAAVAVLHRRGQVELMLFRQGAAPGPDAPGSLLCGAWRYRQ